MDLFRRLFTRRIPAAPTDTDLAVSADRELDAILRFWLRHARDPAGGFWSEWRGRPKRRGARGALLTSRILWTFSAAYRRHPDPAYLAMAKDAYTDLMAVFRDPVHGGFLWSVDAGKDRRNGRKELYGHAFAIYGLSEYFGASGDRAALDEALKIRGLVEAHARDREQGGYFDSLAEDWSAVRPNGNPGPKSQNTMLHLLEAYTNLQLAAPGAGLRADLIALIEFFLAHLLDPSTHHLHQYLTADLKPASAIVSPGHDIEFGWLLMAAARVVGDTALELRCRHAAIAVARVTLPAIEADGGISYEIGPAGLLDPHRSWWVMAEATIGFLDAFELSGDATFRLAAERCWSYIQRHLIDHRGGEWFGRVMPDGRPDRRAAKIHFWKCPYHNARACMELADRARRLGLSPA